MSPSRRFTTLLTGFLSAMVIVILGASAAPALAADSSVAGVPEVRPLTAAQPSVPTSRVLPTALIEKAKPYVSDNSKQATLSPAAAKVLTPAELAKVQASISQYNATPVKEVTRSGPAATSPSARADSLAAAGVRGPTCGWSWSYSSHWYGWYFWGNSCAITWISYATGAVAGISAFIAALQAFLNIPADIATLLAGAFWAASAVLQLQLYTCQSLGYNGISWQNYLGTSVPGC